MMENPEKETKTTFLLPTVSILQGCSRARSNLTGQAGGRGRVSWPDLTRECFYRCLDLGPDPTCQVLEKPSDPTRLDPRDLETS